MTACGNGQWRRIYKGQPHYFGVLDDAEGALQRWMNEWPQIVRGEQRRAPERARRSLTVHEAATAFILVQRARCDAGKIRTRTRYKLTSICRTIVAGLGPHRPVAALGPRDFTNLITYASKRLGLIMQHELVVITRRFIRWAAEDANLPPVRFGDDFRGPSRAERRRDRMKAGPRDLSAKQILRLLAAAHLREYALILLGINCGMDNSGAGALLFDDISWSEGAIRHARHKTAIGRVAPLWPETLLALKCLAAHGRPFVFVTHRGLPLERPHSSGTCRTAAEVFKRSGVQAEGRSFYDLRRTFATVATEAGKDRDLRVIMGHVPKGEDEVHEGYVQTYPISRLRPVTDHVRAWLLAASETGRLPEPLPPAPAADEPPAEQPPPRRKKRRAAARTSKAAP